MRIHIQLPLLYRTLGFFLHWRTLVFLADKSSLMLFSGSNPPFKTLLVSSLLPETQVLVLSSPGDSFSFLGEHMCTPRHLLITFSAWVMFATSGKPLLRFVVKKWGGSVYCYTLLMCCSVVIQTKFVKSGSSIRKNHKGILKKQSNIKALTGKPLIPSAGSS